jgi:peptidoglycan/LPS O-acetylase OafA/YrhL
MIYRKEIDGLRAFAVLPVILFHAGFEVFSGGFVGVDVFFVISGYLITSVIILELDKGSFSLINFYERRARRILPALFLVMLVCLPFAWFLLLPHDLKDFADSLLAVPLSISNFLFWSESGYFDTAAELKPLLHTWSLAVEEQYYLIFPLFLMSLWGFGKKRLLFCMTLVATVGLAYAQWASLAKPAAAFYLLPARSWELLLGAFAAFYVLSNQYKKKSHVVSELGSMTGLILIFYAIFNFSKATPFPGIYALVPTAGTVLVILFGTSDTVTGKLLGYKFFVTIGLLSYSAYLWHQPIFAFARHQSLGTPTDLVFLMLSLASLALAYLSWRFVENPFRNKHWIQKKNIFIMAGLVSLFFMILGLTGILNKGFKGRFEYSNEFEAQFKLQNHRSTCDDGKGHQNGDVPFCAFGDKYHTTPKMVLFGDSHSSALIPVFEKLAQDKGFSFVHNGLGGCIPLINVDVLKGNWDHGICRKVTQKQYEYVKEKNIKNVFLIARWSYYTQGEYEKGMKGYFLNSDGTDEMGIDKSRAVFNSEFNQTIEAYERLGAKVFVVLQIPQQRSEPRKIYSKIFKLNESDEKNKEEAIKKYSVSQSDHLNLQSYYRQNFDGIQKRGSLVFVDPDAVFCHESSCALGTGQFSYYQDTDHVNTSGALQIEALLRDVLENNGVVQD